MRLEYNDEYVITKINLESLFNFRFAQFFLEPLFTQTATEREMNAVHSEHSKNVASDAWRIRQLKCYLGDPTHDYYKFGTGNLSTLDTIPKSKGIDIRYLHFYQR